MAAKSSGNNTKKRRGNPQNLTPWKPGQSGNPAGRKLGTRNRKTVIMDAIRRIAEAEKLDPVEVEDALQGVGIAKALKGSYFHYEAISDGLYGKAQQRIEIGDAGAFAEFEQMSDDELKRLAEESEG